MIRQDMCQQLIDAVNAAIAANPEIAAAMRALQVSGLELESLHITAKLKPSTKEPPANDADFLQALRIIPDLQIRE